MSKTLFMSSVAFLALAAPALAQDSASEAEDEIIVTALRAITPEQATSSYTVIDSADLEIRNTPYLVDQLRAVPGVGVSRSGAVGGLTQLRIRGAEANHTLVLLDGVEVSNPVTGETDFGLWSGLDVQKIEVVRGEHSGLYGSDAIGGVVSITTGGEGIRGAIEYGSFDTYRGHAGASVDLDGASFGVSVSGFSTDGVDTSGLDGERDGSESYSILGRASVDIGENWKLSGFSSYRISEVQSDPDTNFDGLLDNADRETDARQWLVGANLSGDTGPINHVFRASYNDVVLENTADGVFTDETIGQRSKFSYSPSISTDLEGGEVTLSGILDWENEDYERIDTNTFFGDPNQAQSFDTFGIGGELRARFGGFALNGSLRHDDNDDQFDNATTWRVGGAYNFAWGGVGAGKLRASAGTGVKNPTFTELFGFFPGSFIGNPDLQPEQSTGWEVGYDHRFENFEASITYFQADLEDEIITQFNPDFTSSPANLTGDSERSGIEVAAGWAILPNLNLSGAFTVINSENDAGVDEIRVPDWTGSVALDWQSQTKEGFRVGVTLDLVGSQDDFNFGTFPATRVELDSYALLSATAEYPIMDRLSLTLRGENLLDETVTDVFGFNGTGAGVFVGFKIR